MNTPTRPIDFMPYASTPRLGLLHLSESGEKRNPTSLTESPQEDSLSSRLQRKPLRILIVDDEDGFRRSLAFKLRRLYGGNVVEAQSGSVALNLAKSGVFDLILLDISMPGMNGIDTFKEMRKLGINAHIVLMAAYYTPEHQEEAQALGVALLSKPIDQERLGTVLSQAERK